LVVVDPRLTPTGAQADEWIAPSRILTSLVLAMLHHILVKDLHDKAFVQKWVLGFDELKIIFSRKLHPNGRESVTGIPASKIRSQKIMPERNPLQFSATREFRIN